MKREHESTQFEPALGGATPQRDPLEAKVPPAAEPVDDEQRLRDSVVSEPALVDRHDPNAWRRWIEAQRAQCTLIGNLGVTVVAALLGGPAAIVGVFLAGGQGWFQMLYVVVFGPVVEELLKQTGMTYLLERKPYRIFAAWQFVFCGVLAGLVFASIENILYLRVYPRSADIDIAVLAAYRWTVCTALHTVCAAIASLGLVRVWRAQLRDGGPADLSQGFGYLSAAIVLHGLYNLAASLWIEDWLR